MTDEPPAPAALAEQLAGRGVDGIVLTFVDNAGITRVKGIPVSRLETAAARGVGDVSSRSFAARMTERAASAGFEASMAFEIEWVIDSGGDGPYTPATRAPAYGMLRVVEWSDYLRDVLRSLAAEGIQVEQLHPEYAAGQFEVSVAPGTPVGAADDSVLVRQTIRVVGRRHGLRTSFSPSVVAGEVGNGGHVHCSLWRDGQNLFAGGSGPHALTTDADAFAAGILAELPALLAIGAPSVASYQRLVPHRWAGAFQAWGHENREAALRLVTGTAGHEASHANLEVKAFDLSANPYLVVGSLLAAGVEGIRRGARLPPEISGDPGDLSDDELAAVGAGRLPVDLASAVERFAASAVLAEALGGPLHETLIAVRRAEIERFDGATAEEVSERTRWRH